METVKHVTFQDRLSGQTRRLKNRGGKPRALLIELLLGILPIVCDQTAPAIAGRVTSTKVLMSMQESILNQTNKAIAQ